MDNLRKNPSDKRNHQMKPRRGPICTITHRADMDSVHSNICLASACKYPGGAICFRHLIKFTSYNGSATQSHYHDIHYKIFNPKGTERNMKKHLSAIANDLLLRCAQTLDTSVDALVDDFESELKPGVFNYSRKLVEFCSIKALENICRFTGEKITDGSLGRFTFDMMLAWEMPSSADEESFSEGIAKESEDKKTSLVGEHINDDIPLFYSDIMPLLVDEERSVGEEAFVWLGSLFPLLADVTNARFTFETLTAPTANKLHFPAYDRFLKEIDKCRLYLQNLAGPTGFELADDEFVLHVEGTASSQRVVRHIGATSWPGRLTLTNHALYFEASKAMSYETALRIDLSNSSIEHQVSAASTGPWGAPLFDKAVSYESSLQPEPVILEFPEMTSSTRRDHWLALIREVILLHQFIAKFDIEPPFQTWEMHSRVILGVIRLHAAREMLRIAPPAPTSFLIFALFEDLPKGDYVLEDLSSSLKKTNSMHPCSATSILKSLNMSHPGILNAEVKEGLEAPLVSEEATLTSLGTTIDQVREEAKEAIIAKATVKGMKEEGIADSFLILMELLSPLKNVPPSVQSMVRWERPIVSSIVLSVTLLIIYKEWMSYTIAAILMYGVSVMVRMQAQHQKVDASDEVVVSASSDKTTMENIVEAHHSMKDVHEAVKLANVSILKIQSILLSRAPKHTTHVIWAMSGVAILTALIPFKIVLMGVTVYVFMSNLKVGKSGSDSQVERRIREWWDSIPVIPVRVET